jgi:hypothetical protein
VADEPRTFYELATARLADQMKQIETIDTKTDKVIGYSTATLGLYGAALTVVGKSLNPVGFTFASFFFLAAFVVYVAVNISALRAYQVRNYSYRPDMEVLQQNADELTEDALRTWVARECVISLRENDDIITNRTTELARAIRLFPLQVLLLTAAGLSALL